LQDGRGSSYPPAQQARSTSARSPDEESIRMENIVVIVVIVLIVLFVLGYFGRGRMRG
jgi:cobalamin biosynthesis Mg chelatase CobN